MADQSLDNFSRLAVIKHVHDIAVAKCTPSAFARFTACFSQLRMVSSVTDHSGSRRRGRVVTIQLSICRTKFTSVRGTRRTASFGGRPRRPRTFSDSTRTNGLKPSRSNDSGVSVLASPMRMPVFHRVANSI